MPLFDRVNATAALIRTFTTPFERPDRLPKALAVMAPWGPSIAGLAAGAAARYPTRAAIVDETGGLTFGELWRRSLGIAAALQDRGIGPGSRVGLLARNHAGFVECVVAISATGADTILLNTGFAGPQLADVVASEGISMVLHDDEFADIVIGCGADTLRERDHQPLALTHRAMRPNRKAGAVVILTSGTTGRPKGAARTGGASSIEGIAAVLDAIPLRLGDVQAVPAPLFHAWGLSHLLLGLARCATTVLSRRFEPEQLLRQLITHDVNVLVVVPVMLTRLLAVPDTSAFPELRVIASSGSALGAKLTTDVLDPLRARALQPLRLDRGRRRHRGRPHRPRRCAEHGRARGPRRARRSPRSGRPAGAGGQHRPHLRRWRDEVRGLHRRRREGGPARPRVHRRPRPLRRRPALRRRAARTT